MRLLFVVAILAVLGGCSTNSGVNFVSLSYSLDLSDEGCFKYFINGQFVGVGKKGLQRIYDHLMTLPDGATVEISRDTNVIYTPIVSGSALGTNARGSSGSFFDMWSFPIGDSRIKELIELKRMVVVKKRKGVRKGVIAPR